MHQILLKYILISLLTI